MIDAVELDETRDPGTYVPCHLGIWTSPKTLGLARQLKKSKETIVGHLLQMLGHLQHHAPDGDLEGWSPLDLKAIANWRGKADVWVDALVAHGWMDREGDRLVPHDWKVYGGRGVVERASARERQRKSRAKRAAQVAEAVTGEPVTVVTPVTGAVTAGHTTPRDMSQPVTVTSRDVTPQVEEEAEEKRESARAVTVTVTAGHSDQSVTARDSGVTAAAPRPPASAHPRAAAQRKYASRLPHEMEFWRDSPEELLASSDPGSARRTFGERLQATYPAYDGREGRPQILTLVRAKWAAFERKFFADGLGAFDGLEAWIGDNYERARRSYERGTPTLNLAAIGAGIPKNLRPEPEEEP